MASPLLCYGDDLQLDALADLAVDFDYLSTMERETWLVRQWREVAAAMGWLDLLELQIAALKKTNLGLAGLDAGARSAFSSFISGVKDSEGGGERAKVRQDVLMALQTPGASLWHASSGTSTLPGGVCYGLPQWKPQPPKTIGGLAAKTPTPTPKNGGVVVQTPERAFLADAGPSYFWGSVPTTVTNLPGCGWQTPLRLSLGTFPWVYGSRLQAPAPGLSWHSGDTAKPAATALQIASGMWQPAGNLREDGGAVADAWRFWMQMTEPLASRLPPWDGSERRVGAVYQRGLLLEVYQGAGELAGLSGPRGFVCAAAYNFIQRRYAAFFCMRRALLRAYQGLLPELKALINQSSDACVAAVAKG
ncbi:MAG: hypothetical protein R3B09_01725 [Nannocystaceae bacterium]